MLTKFVFVFLCLSVIQGYNAQVPLTCSQKVKQLQLEISGLASQAKIDVSVAASAINKNIAITRSTIKNAVLDLQTKASTVVGPNAQICKNKLTTDLSAVNDQGLKLCYSSLEINVLKQQISQQLNSLKSNASLICQSCLDDACSDGKIDSTRQQAQDLQQGFSSEANAIQEASTQCTQNAGSEQLEVVQNASDNLDTCIQGP